LRLASSRVVFLRLTTLEDAGAVSGETSGKFKCQDHGLQPGHLLQGHHNNSG
ncbi:hypothetical protein L9F63_020997, partial [Diploptera punctata]